MKKQVKLGIKLTLGSIGLLPASVLVLGQLDVTTSTNSNWIANRTFFRDCNSNNANFGDVPLTKVSMLASHDSLSDEINIFSKANTNQELCVGGLFYTASVVGKGAIVRYSRAQTDNIYDQLDAGVRYIDARITHLDGQYYTSHGLISDTLEHYLKQILQWLKDNPGEFVCFHIYYFYYDNTKETEIDAWNNLKTYMETIKNDDGKNLFDYDYNQETPFGELTYNNITKNGTVPGAVIFHSDDDNPKTEEEKNLWCYKHIFYNNINHIFNPCAGSMNTNTIIDNVKTWTSKVKSNFDEEQYGVQSLKYIQTQTTPNYEEIPGTAISYSLLQKAHDHNYYMLHDSGIDWSETFKYMPIYMCDYSTCNDNGFCSDLLKIMSNFNLTLK